MRLTVDDLTSAVAPAEPNVLEREEATREAAVAAILRPGPTGEAEALFIRRAQHPRDPWSGHMAFPGGRHEDVDAHLQETAVRETREELGLDLTAAGRFVGALDEIQAVARGKAIGLIVRPHVFVLEERAPLAPNGEVAEALWAPLGPLYRGEQNTIQEYKRNGYDLRLPAYDVDGRVIWGLTYQMLQGLFGWL